MNTGAPRRRGARAASAVSVLIIGAGLHCDPTFSEDEPVGVADAAPGADVEATGEGPLPTEAGVDGSDASDGSDAADGAGDGGAVACGGRPNCERVVFVTSATFSGGIGGSAGGDMSCTTAATNPAAHPRVRGRTFDAWLSTDTSAVGARLPQGSRSYVLPDGAPVAKSWADLIDGQLVNGIAVNEFGASVPSLTEAWTGTSGNGAGVAGDNCLGWTASGNAMTGVIGAVSAANGGWTNYTSRPCNLARRLYCIEH